MLTRFLIPILLLVPFLNVAQATHDLPTPVAWWKLDELAGATTFQEEVANNDGTCTAPNCPVMGISGAVGTAGDFDGLGDQINIAVPNSAIGNLNPNGVTSFSFWTRDDNVATEGAPLGKGSNSGVTGFGYFFNLLGPGTLGGCCTGKLEVAILAFANGQGVGTPDPPTPTGRALSSATITDNAFHHWVVEIDLLAGRTQSVTYYFDGFFSNRVNFVDNANVFTNSNTQLLIGARRTGTSQVPFDGALDQVRIWNTTTGLTASNVEDLFLDPDHHACSDQGAVDAQTGFLSNLMPLLILMFLLTVVAVRIPIPRLK